MILYSAITVNFIRQKTPIRKYRNRCLFMLRGHDLKLVRPQITRMLATARKLRPTFQRGLEAPAENNHIHQSDRGSISQFVKVQYSTRLMGQTA